MWTNTTYCHSVLRTTFGANQTCGRSQWAAALYIAEGHLKTGHQCCGMFQIIQKLNGTLNFTIFEKTHRATRNYAIPNQPSY